MFPLHQQVKRRWAMAGFFGLCVLPTVLVLFWGVVRLSPRHRHQQAQTVSALMGMSASIDSVSHPRPGVVRYHAFSLQEPETNRTVFQTACLEIHEKRLPLSDGKSKSVLTLHALEPTIALDQTDSLGELLHRALAKGLTTCPDEVRLNAAKIELASGGKKIHLVDLKAILRHQPKGSVTEIVFYLAERKEGQTPVKIRIGRTRAELPATDWFDVETGKTPLPCIWLAKAITPFDLLGPKATFEGYFWAKKTPAGWEANVQAKPTEPKNKTAEANELKNVFRNVDLGVLTGKDFPHHLTGLSDWQIHSAHYRNGRIETLLGRVKAEAGTIGTTLLESLERELGILSTKRSFPVDSNVSYQKLECQFHLDSQGIRLAACPTNTSGGTILEDRSGQLLWIPGTPSSWDDIPPRSTASLVRAFFPTQDDVVPATTAANRLTGRLPLAK